MKLVIIRHGDPDYVKDWLTPRGEMEAKMLSERVSKMDIQEIYVSPLGRAKATASYSLEKMGRTATELEWLREFPNQILRPDLEEGKRSIAWDWLPQDWAGQDAFYDRERWSDNEILEEAEVRKNYDRVVKCFDEFLEQHGYVRSGKTYRVEKANNDTIVFFCHFGLECVLLSHLMNVSPMVLWHSMIAAPTSVTTVITEERREGTAIFRVSAFGDTSHLYAKGEQPAFAGRFCECYKNTDERH